MSCRFQIVLHAAMVFMIFQSTVTTRIVESKEKRFYPASNSSRIRHQGFFPIGIISASVNTCVAPTRTSPLSHASPRKAHHRGTAAMALTGGFGNITNSR